MRYLSGERSFGGDGSGSLCGGDLQGPALEGLAGFPGDRHSCPDAGKLAHTADGYGVDRRLDSEMLAYS